MDSDTFPSGERPSVTGVAHKMQPDNLYVVDASVFPVIPSAVPNLTVMMLGERAADWLSTTN